MYFLGHFLIALIILIPLIFVFRDGLKDFNSRDPVKRTFAKSIVLGSVMSCVFIILYLFDAYFNTNN